MAKKTVLVTAESAARGAVTLDNKINQEVASFSEGEVTDYTVNDSNLDQYGYGSALVTIEFTPKAKTKTK